jgi:hypothetical protein
VLITSNSPLKAELACRDTAKFVKDHEGPFGELPPPPHQLVFLTQLQNTRILQWLFLKVTKTNESFGLGRSNFHQHGAVSWYGSLEMIVMDA